MRSQNKLTIGAIVLAAGLSSRMGVQKMLLPWKRKTVIETVVKTIISSGVKEIIVVTGRDSEKLIETLQDDKVICVFNPLFSNGNMIDSLKCGIEVIKDKVDAILMVLGDQPQMDAETIFRLIQGWISHPNSICIPSNNMRRGHPWIIPSAIWDDLFSMKPQETMRDFIQNHSESIHYVIVDSPTILMDLDTPEDFQKQTS